MKSTSFELEAVRYAPLQSHEVDELLGRVAALHPSPPFSLPSPGDSMLMRGLSDQARRQNYAVAASLLLPNTEAIRRYKEEKRPAWLAEVRRRLEAAHWLLCLEQNQLALAIRVENRGTVPATSLLLRLCGRAGAVLCLPPEFSRVPGPGPENVVLRLPSPPAPPKPNESLLEAMATYHRAFMEPETTRARRDDPRAFYWRRHHSGLGHYWETGCAEFQHQDVPEDIALRLAVGPEAAQHGRCAIECIVQAANQPEPLTSTLPVQVLWREGNTMNRLRQLFAGSGFLEASQKGHELDSLQEEGDLPPACCWVYLPRCFTRSRRVPVNPPRPHKALILLGLPVRDRVRVPQKVPRVRCVPCLTSAQPPLAHQASPLAAHVGLAYQILAAARHRVPGALQADQTGGAEGVSGAILTR